jgi:hypothetical protein
VPPSSEGRPRGKPRSSAAAMFSRRRTVERVVCLAAQTARGSQRPGQMTLASAAIGGGRRRQRIADSDVTAYRGRKVLILCGVVEG